MTTPTTPVVKGAGSEGGTIDTTDSVASDHPFGPRPAQTWQAS
jgi:hypothetical protein